MCRATYHEGVAWAVTVAVPETVIVAEMEAEGVLVDADVDVLRQEHDVAGGLGRRLKRSRGRHREVSIRAYDRSSHAATPNALT